MAAAPAVYEYRKRLRGQSFGLSVTVLHGATRIQIIDALAPAVVTTGVNWIVEPSHLLFNNEVREILLPLDNVVAVARSIDEDTVDLIVRFPTADT